MNLESELKIKQLELQSFFEIIRAINMNASESDLYKIFTWTIRSNVNIKKMALFVGDEKNWWCKSSFGTEHSFENIVLHPAFLGIHKISAIPEEATHFQEFWRVIPIKHKSKTLAYVFLSYAEDLEKDTAALDFIETLSNIIVVAIENKRFARKENEQQLYRQQIEDSKKVQSFLLPKSLPNNARIQVVATYLPSFNISGDYYDYIEITKDKFLICIADVSGKGIPAAIFMANFQAGLRMLCRQAATSKDLSLLKMVKELNALISQNSQGEIFITAFFLTYDFITKKITYINAGHNFPFLLRKNGQLERLDQGTIMMGSFKTLPFIHETTFEEVEEFFVFAFTDGFVDAENSKTGQRFGDKELESFIRENIYKSPQELHDLLIPLLNNFKENNTNPEKGDDITLLSCKVNNSSRV